MFVLQRTKMFSNTQHNLDPSLDETHLIQFGTDRCSGLDREIVLGLQESEKMMVNLLLTAI